MSGILLLALRFVLATENKRRDASAQETDSLDEVYVEQKDESGAVREAKVDKVSCHDESFYEASTDVTSYRLSSTSPTSRTRTSDTSYELLAIQRGRLVFISFCIWVL